MNEEIRPVLGGIALGLVTLAFGIAWAAFLATGHEWIHDYTERARTASVSGYAFAYSEGPSHMDVGEGSPNMEGAHMEEPGGPPHTHGMEGGAHGAVSGVGYEPPLGELVHERLRRGHIHAMGLGLLAIVVSFVFAFISAPVRVKVAGSLMVGVGGLLYPFSWIIMGLRTPALGAASAEASVIFIVGPCLLLILGSIALALLFLLKTLVLSDKAREGAGRV